MRPRGKKDDIERAAIELFALKGPASTTTKDIAKKSGVTDGALYRHYESKEALATALFARELEKIRLALLIEIEQDAPPEAKLRGIIACIYERYETEPHSTLFVLLNFQNMQGINLPGETGNMYDFILRHTRNILSDLPGSFSEITPTLLAGLIVEPILFHHYGRLPNPPSTYVGDVAAACNRLLGLEKA